MTGQDVADLLLYWADIDPADTETVDAFWECIQNSSIPEACGVIGEQWPDRTPNPQRTEDYA